MKIELIQQTVCDFYGLKNSDLLVRTRKRHIVFARQIIIYLSIFYLKYTFQKSAEIYGLNHATAIHAKKTIKNIYDTSKNYRRQIDEIKKIIEGESLYCSLVVRHVDLLQLSINYTNSIIQL